LVDNHGGDFAAYLAWFELKTLMRSGSRALILLWKKDEV